VLSSISSSNTQNWVKSWMLALIIAFLTLATMEVFWRANGHRPVIVDDQRLWALERSKLGKSQKEIALIGSSRMQSDISMATLKQLTPGYNIINLSADSTCGNAVLLDLASDMSFKGVVIFETTSECLMFGNRNEFGLSQQFYVDYFHKTFNLNIKINRYISTFVQKNLTVVDPYLNLIKVLGDLVIKRKLRKPSSLTTYEDRSRAVDYDISDIEVYKSKRIRKASSHYMRLAPYISPNELIEQVSDLDNAVQKIKNRGGEVIFVRFPVSDEHWDLDQHYFPRAVYWDSISTKSSATIIHFKDIEGMNTLQCPDTSHLDVSDQKRFTIQLFNELRKEKIF
jgi:hypothetical protein